MVDSGVFDSCRIKPFPAIFQFMGKKAKEFMRVYYDAQERMSTSAVQYVRGMPIVKILGKVYTRSASSMQRYRHTRHLL